MSEKNKRIIELPAETDAYILLCLTREKDGVRSSVLGDKISASDLANGAGALGALAVKVQVEALKADGKEVNVTALDMKVKTAMLRTMNGSIADGGMIEKC